MIKIGHYNDHVLSVFSVRKNSKSKVLGESILQEHKSLDKTGDKLKLEIHWELSTKTDKQK